MVISGACTAAVMALLLLTHWTVAYLIGSDEKKGGAVTGSLDAVITETIHGFEKKDIFITNDGSASCYLRVFLRPPKVLDEDGTFYRITVIDWSQREVDLEVETVIPAKEGVWQRDESDGYWYYSKAAAPGEAVPFLSSIKYEGMKEGEKVGRDRLNLVIYAQAAQSDNREVMIPKDAFVFPKE